MNNIFKECNTYTNEIVKKLKNLYESEIRNIRKLHEEELTKLKPCKKCESYLKKLNHQKQITKDLEKLCSKSHMTIISQR